MDAVTLDRQRIRIAEWMRLLLQPGQVVEVRALHPFASRTFATAEPGAIEALAAFAAAHSGKSKGVYFTPNPLKGVRGSGKDGTHLDADVDRRAWLLLDFDPVRPDRAHTNSTAAERAAALEVAQAVRETLICRGFSGMVLGDSGNGYHLMAPVGLANNDAARDWHRNLIRHLAERFGTPAVEIDPKTFNAARIWKVPGTLAMKGPHSADRPHRYARILETMP
jgi:hypothetical protein